MLADAALERPRSMTCDSVAHAFRPSRPSPPLSQAHAPLRRLCVPSSALQQPCPKVRPSLRSSRFVSPCLRAPTAPCPLPFQSIPMVLAVLELTLRPVLLHRTNSTLRSRRLYVTRSRDQQDSFADGALPWLAADRDPLVGLRPGRALLPIDHQILPPDPLRRDPRPRCVLRDDLVGGRVSGRGPADARDLELGRQLDRLRVRRRVNFERDECQYGQRRGQRRVLEDALPVQVSFNQFWDRRWQRGADHPYPRAARYQPFKTHSTRTLRET